MNSDIYTAIEIERQRVLPLWTELDETQTLDNFIAHSISYLGRATSSRRNDGLDRKEMLIKAMGLLVTGIEKRL
jgi:hypothetical protein